MRARYLALPLVLLVALAIVLGIALGRDPEPSPKFRGSIPPPGITLPDFELRASSGDMFRASNLRDKVVLVTFLDSQCTESCPIIAAQMAAGLERLTPDERRRVVALAISTDPKEDTAESIRAFLRRNRAEGKVRYLVEPESEMRPVWKAFNILPSADTGIDELHSAPVRIYRRGVWATTLHAGADLTPGNLAHDIRVALAS